MMREFNVYPAIDLRDGYVVRLMHGDPGQQTTYSSDPETLVTSWLDAGVKWLHVINLDGAFGENDSANFRILKQICPLISNQGARIQFGGGLRTAAAIQAAFELGIDRVILGTIAVENPQLTREIIEEHDPDQIAISLDAMQGRIRVRGWQTDSSIQVSALGKQLAEYGLSWLIFTDISRDGAGKGVNISSCLELKQATGINIIASGGVNSIEDIRAAREAGLAGIIVGRALYEKKIRIEDCI